MLNRGGYYLQSNYSEPFFVYKCLDGINLTIVWTRDPFEYAYLIGTSFHPDTSVYTYTEISEEEYQLFLLTGVIDT